MGTAPQHLVGHDRLGLGDGVGQGGVAALVALQHGPGGGRRERTAEVQVQQREPVTALSLTSGTISTMRPSLRHGPGHLALTGGPVLRASQPGSTSVRERMAAATPPLSTTATVAEPSSTPPSIR